MEVTYCEVWSGQLRSPTGEMSEATARERDANGEHYCVVLGKPESPHAVLDITRESSSLRVSFVDEEGRTHTQYNFQKMGTGKLFLSDVTTWGYPAGALFEFEADLIESAEFRPDGYASRTVDDSASEQVKKTEYTDVPVEVNWEPIPEFGHWESVARYDRDA